MTRYKDDPRWMKARYAGTDKNGQPFAKGAEVLYYPRTKTILQGEEAEREWQNFISAAADEDVYNGCGMAY